MKICGQCGQRKNIPRGTICAACIKKNQRAKLKEPKEPTKSVTNSPTELQVDAATDGFEIAEDEPQALKMTPADKAWWEKNKSMGDNWPNWVELITSTCNNCKKPFKTHLNLRRDCGCE